MAKHNHNQSGYALLIGIVAVSVSLLFLSIVFVTSKSASVADFFSPSETLQTGFGVNETSANARSLSICNTQNESNDDTVDSPLRTVIQASKVTDCDATVEVSRQASAAFVEQQLSCSGVKLDPTLVAIVNAAKKVSAAFEDECTRDIIDALQLNPGS